jgi:hypothetical protein
MDVLTEEEVRLEVSAKTSRLPLYISGFVYGLVVVFVVAHHEPWADEAQSWLLARDAGLADLWTRLLHYEGTTGLWQTLLHGLIAAHLPYLAMNGFSALLGLAAACVLLWRSPFPLVIRVALPFTFFLCYQYAVIARSYDLLPLLLFCCAALYDRAHATPVLFTTLLCLMAAVSVHGMALAVAIGVSALINVPDRRKFAIPVAFFASVAILFAVLARPAADATFIPGLNFSAGHFLAVSAKAFSTAFTGELFSSLLIVALSLPVLWRGGGWLFFLLASLTLCGISSVVYSQVWHHGVLFLAWLFAVWISLRELGTGSARLRARLSNEFRAATMREWFREPCGMALRLSLFIVLAVQCFWTAASIGYDWQSPYSGSLAAAQGIRELPLDGKKIYAIGFANIAIEPYFPRNIFANVNDGQPRAYWDWSRNNHVNEDARHLATSRPDYVIVGYKNEFERGVWTDLVRQGGYRAIRHFEGNTFWQTRILEPESYDLFERIGAP